MSGYTNHLRYGSCFVARTLVVTGASLVTIEEIKAGDLVWAWDEETGDVALKKVVETYINVVSTFFRCKCSNTMPTGLNLLLGEILLLR